MATKVARENEIKRSNNNEDKEDQWEESVDSESGEKKLPYPKSVFFIVGNEFCERFSFYGMKAILAIYFHQKLHYSEDTSTVVYHAFSMLCYFTPIFGALLADQFLGKFRTIFYISLIYVFGHALKTLAAIPSLGLPPSEFSLIGLALIAIGTGGIKPCVAAFGGDQFKMPEQERLLQTFFSVFYFSINAGSLISTALTPILREDVSCFGEDTCYSLAFGVPALLMLIATVILVIGKPMYNIKPPQGNILTKVVGSIWTSVCKKFTSKEKKEHWLDHAKEKYGENLVEDTKVLLSVLTLFLPIPVFWALFDQQGSRWTFQAQRANGMVGNYLIKPDQMQLFNPLMILVLIPIFDRIIYPQFAKINLLKKPLQRICVGGIITAIAFYISGFLELSIMGTYEKIPAKTESHLHVMNTLNCPVIVKLPSMDENSSPDGFLHYDMAARGNEVIYGLEAKEYKLTIKPASQSSQCRKIKGVSHTFQGIEGSVSEIIIQQESDQIKVGQVASVGKPKKTSNSFPKIRFVLDYPASKDASIRLQPTSSDEVVHFVPNNVSIAKGVVETNYTKVYPDVYNVWVDDILLGKTDLGPGGVHSVVISKNSSDTNIYAMNDFLLTQENTVHMFSMIPQYVVITVGEVMLSITGLEFSYSQAPASMKSVVQAAWLLTVAFGNVIVIIVAEAKAFDNQAAEFFMFGTLMLIDMGWFIYLAANYRYTDKSRSADTEEISLDDKEEAKAE